MSLYQDLWRRNKFMLKLTDKLFPPTLLLSALLGFSTSLSAGTSDVQQQVYIKASNADRADFFGGAVAISGDTLVVGVENEGSSASGINGNQSDNSAPTSGAVYVFVREGDSWSQQAYIKASNTGGGDKFGAPGDHFGASVAIDGDTIVVGAPEEKSKARGVNGDQSDNTVDLAGAAYVFVRNGSSWSQQAYLKASNTIQLPNTFIYFEYGSSVAVSGDTVVVGAHGEHSNAGGINGDQSDTSLPYSGAAYVYTRSGTSWSQQAYIKASNPDEGDLFGLRLDLSGDSLVVGARSEASNATGINGNQSDNSAPFTGAAYVFARNGSVWSQQAYLKASNADHSDSFGFSVAIDGETVVVGANQESSNATGVNGDESNNSLGFAGAAYVFTRSGSKWSQQAYLKASNAGFRDRFGQTVTIGGDMLAVGTQNEESSATGIDGDQQDNSAPGAGAVYLFARDGGEWSQQAYIKASNTDSDDQFGKAIAINGDTLVVGAEREDSGESGIDADQQDNSVLSTGAVYVFTELAGNEAFSINAGLNDSWVHADAPFQGMFVTVFPVLKLIFVAWFTFDSEQPPEDMTAVFGAPDQRWVTALGFYDGNRTELRAELTTGGLFNSSEPLPVQDTNYGTINIEFSHCNLASVDYDFPSTGESGFFTMQRVVESNVALCEALNTE